MMLNLENDGDTVLDDGLSDDEDPLSPRQQRPMTSAEAAARAAAAKQHKQCQIFLLFLTWTMSLVVATIKYYSRPGEYYIAGRRNDGPMLEKENELRLKYALEYLTSISGLEFPNPMSESSNMTGDSSANNAIYNSPQYQAAEWIAKVDKRRLPIPQYSFNGKSYTSQKDEYPFLQRYVYHI